jgi:N utilization substance protein A
MKAQPDEIEEVRRLFHEHVPQVASGVVELKGIARERGYLTIVAVRSIDSSVEAVAACVGERGVRIKTIKRHLTTETINIVLWSDSLERFLNNLFAPVKIEGIILNEVARYATLFTSLDDKALLISRGEMRLKLGSRLTNWDIHVETG